MTVHRVVQTRAAASLVLGALAFAGCGSQERQDANEKAGTYTVDVTQASFPRAQRLAKQSEMRIAVKNTGNEALPDVAVTVDSFSRRSEQAGLADPERPVWIVDQGPAGGGTALVNTWALDGLAPGQTRTFTWKVTPVEAGRYDLKYTVAAGLDGKAKARDANGRSPVGGTFAVRVSRKPADARVNPETGEVERGSSSGDAEQ